VWNLTFFSSYLHLKVDIVSLVSYSSRQVCVAEGRVPHQACQLPQVTT